MQTTRYSDVTLYHTFAVVYEIAPVRRTTFLPQFQFTTRYSSNQPMPAPHHVAPVTENALMIFLFMIRSKNGRKNERNEIQTTRSEYVISLMVCLSIFFILFFLFSTFLHL